MSDLCSFAAGMTAILLLCFFAFIAGFVDAIAGGGGLIQLPAYFILMPHFTITQLLGSNKLGGFSGTLVATIQYLRKIKVNWKIIFPALLVAGLSALVGAQCVSFLNKEKLAPFVVMVLILILVYTALNKQTGISDAKPVVSAGRFQLILLFAAFIIGFYDGFFGPGAGSLLMFVFISLLHFDFLNAAAYTKVFNCVTNVGALAFFIFHGDVVYHVAIPVALCNVAGNYFGSALAIKKGSPFIRVIYIVVVSALIVKMIYDYYIK